MFDGLGVPPAWLRVPLAGLFVRDPGGGTGIPPVSIIWGYTTPGGKGAAGYVACRVIRCLLGGGSGGGVLSVFPELLLESISSSESG